MTEAQHIREKTYQNGGEQLSSHFVPSQHPLFFRAEELLRPASSWWTTVDLIGSPRGGCLVCFLSSKEARVTCASTKVACVCPALKVSHPQCLPKIIPDIKRNGESGGRGGIRKPLPRVARMGRGHKSGRGLAGRMGWDDGVGCPDHQRHRPHNSVPQRTRGPTSKKDRGH
jgi:hypothetical protein